jgi:hypothetical protein
MDAMLRMKKIDIAALEAAAESAGSRQALGPNGGAICAICVICAICAICGPSRGRGGP